MITVGMDYDVVAGKEAAFERKFELVVRAMRGAEGHAHADIFRSVAQARRYMILSRWVSRASFDAFIASDAFAKLTAWGRSGILAGRPTHAVFGDEGPLLARRAQDEPRVAAPISAKAP